MHVVQYTTPLCAEFIDILGGPLCEGARWSPGYLLDGWHDCVTHFRRVAIRPHHEVDELLWHCGGLPLGFGFVHCEFDERNFLAQSFPNDAYHPAWAEYLWPGNDIRLAAVTIAGERDSSDGCNVGIM